MRRGLLLLPLLVALAAPLHADELLVLKDGRKFTVTRLARRAGKVRFETKEGKVFEVPEDQVASPALETIPMAGAPAATPTPAPPPAPAAGEQILELKDGRKIAVKRLARRGGMVLFETTKGESFSVPEDQVVSPPLASIPQLQPPKPPGPTPAPAPTPPPVKPPVATPPPPVTPPVVPAAPPPPPTAGEFVPYPDRWNILDKLPDDPRLVRGRTIDPYNQNTLKGDRPIIGNSVFLVLTGTLETPFETRRLPAVGGVSTRDPGSFEFFGRGNQLFTTPRAFASAELFQGQTAFRPKTWAIKGTAAFNVNYLRVQERNAVTVDVRDDITRRREDFSFEEAFGELKLATVSKYYDFVSVRVGIQPFVSDFRGLVFSDFNLGARLFGNWSNNRWSYNAIGFNLLEKDTNSELNTFEKREQKVFIANVFRQDFLTKGYTLSASYHYSKDEPNFHYDKNGVLVRPAPVGQPEPHEVISKYVGLAGDGHIGRLNVSHAFYYAFGKDEDNVVAGREVEIRAYLGALEASIDRDWLRLKLSGFWASGDDEPLDEKAKGFDSIYDNPNFAGGPFSFWNRSAIALLQTKVLLKPPLTLLPSLRSNKFEGQSNFVNPGLRLVGLSTDLELTPKIRATLNANYLWFDKLATLKTLLFQSVLEKSIGIDWGAGVVYRPLLNENIVISAGITGLLPAKGFDLIYESVPCGTPGCGFPGRKLLNGFVNVKLTY
jgi:hypothetical protein